MIRQLKNSHSSATFMEYDAWFFFNHLLDHAKEYDMTDILGYCPDWYDQPHSLLLYIYLFLHINIIGHIQLKGIVNR
jgi:hypothetical protein